MQDGGKVGDETLAQAAAGDERAQRAMLADALARVVRSNDLDAGLVRVELWSRLVAARGDADDVVQLARLLLMRAGRENSEDRQDMCQAFKAEAIRHLSDADAAGSEQAREALLSILKGEPAETLRISLLAPYADFTRSCASQYAAVASGDKAARSAMIDLAVAAIADNPIASIEGLVFLRELTAIALAAGDVEHSAIHASSMFYEVKHYAAKGDDARARQALLDALQSDATFAVAAEDEYIAGELEAVLRETPHDLLVCAACAQPLLLATVQPEGHC